MGEGIGIGFEDAMARVGRDMKMRYRQMLMHTDRAI